MRFLTPMALVAGLAGAGLVACAPAEEVVVERPSIEMPRTPGGVGVAYFTIKSSQPDRIVGLTSPSAKALEMHKSVIEGGMAKMQRQTSVDLPANTRIAFKQGGLHVMVFDPLPIAAGATFPITIELESGLKKLVDFPLAGSAEAGQHH